MLKNLAFWSLFLFGLSLTRRAMAGRQQALLAPVAVGLALWIGFPSPIAFQDVTSLIAGTDGRTARWNAALEAAAAGSVHRAEMAFADATAVAGSVSGAGLKSPDVGSVAIMATKIERADTPDEVRVVRTDKRGRLLRVAPVAPPPAFNAGSILQRSSLLVPPASDEEPLMAFAMPEIGGREIEIATAFHAVRPPRPPRDVPTTLASLVNNDKPDILAVAYAPSEPDYARASPFASLLAPEDPDAGRFIPPVGPNEHEWMRKPLPAHVFSESEQKCLAEAIYFEARGENVKGQAAVAQVVLNRVRNPSFPDTICGVVYQNDHWHNRCQFSFACDGIKDRITSPSHYRLATEIALAVTAGRIFIPEVGSSTHYHATYVRPRWSRAMEKMKKIGLHIFYRTYGGGWS
jgi:spore germination cell wall hydrolase CwlJ-like protein